MVNEEEGRARVEVSATVFSCFSQKERKKVLNSRYPLRVCSRPMRVLRTPGRAHTCRSVSAADEQQQEKEEGSRQSESAFCALLLRLAEFKWS